MSEDLLQRMRTAVDNERKRAASQDQGEGQDQAAGQEQAARQDQTAGREADIGRVQAAGQQQVADRKSANGQRQVADRKQAVRRKPIPRRRQTAGHGRGQVASSDRPAANGLPAPKSSEPADLQEPAPDSEDVTQPIAIPDAATSTNARPVADESSTQQNCDATIRLFAEIPVQQAAVVEAPAQRQPRHQNGMPKAPERQPRHQSGVPNARGPVTAPRAPAPAAKPKAPAPAAKPQKAPAPRPAAPRAGRGRALAGRRYRLAGVAIAMLVLIAAGSLAFALLRPGKAAPRTSHAAGAGAAIRAEAANWVVGQVSPAAAISCDKAMCATLLTDGVSPGQLVELRSGRDNPLDSDVIVATAAVRTLLGRSLGKVYAPAILASFGSGVMQIDVRVIAKDGAAAYMSELSKDVATRKESAATLLQSPRITLSVPARHQLAAGQVDSRLVEVISDLAFLHPVYIVAFGDAGPHANPEMPLRSAELTQARGTHQMSPAFVRSMQSALRTLTAELRPALVKPLTLAAHQAVLSIEYGAPSPLNLLGPSGP